MGLVMIIKYEGEDIVDQQHETVALHGAGIANLGLKIGANW